MKELLAFTGALVLSLAVAVGLDPRTPGKMIAAATVLGAVQGFLWLRLLVQKTNPRAAFIGAIAGFVVAFLLTRSTLPWIDFGAIDGGVPGELPLVVLPLASLIALGATFRRRGAWRSR